MALLLVFLVSLLAGPALAQENAPPSPPPASVICATTTLAVTGSSASVALPSTLASCNVVTVLNDGANEAFVNFGGSSVAATTSATPVPSGGAMSLWTNQTYVAGITASGNSTLRVVQANGPVRYSATNGNGTGGAVPSLPPVTTYQGTMTLTAATSTTLTSGNVTMGPNSAALPAAGSFARLVIIAPAGCTFNVLWQGGTATATNGEQMGSGTNVSSDTVNLTGNANAPTLYSTAGCASPNLVQFHN